MPYMELLPSNQPGLLWNIYEVNRCFEAVKRKNSNKERKINRKIKSMPWLQLWSIGSNIFQALKWIIWRTWGRFDFQDLRIADPLWKRNNQVRRMEGGNSMLSVCAIQPAVPWKKKLLAAPFRVDTQRWHFTSLLYYITPTGRFISLLLAGTSVFVYSTAWRLEVLMCHSKMLLFTSGWLSTISNRVLFIF